MKTIRSILACILTCIASLNGQQEDHVQTEILTVAVKGDTPFLFYRSGEKIYRLSASATGMGAPLLYHGPRKLDLYSQAQHLTPPKEGESPTPPIATITLPDANRIILLFAPDDKQPDRIQVKAFGVGKDSLQAGDYMGYNFTDKPVLVMLGMDKEVFAKTAIAPGKSAKLSANKLRNEVLDLPVQIGISDNGKNQVVSRKLWGHRNQKRTFLFFFEGPDKNRPLDIRRYFDVPGVEVVPSTADEVTLSGKKKN